MTAAPIPIREFEVRARTTDTFGRVQCQARNHYFVVDGPTYNNCAGEAITPGEVFLSGVASCGIELLDVIARETNVPLKRASVRIFGRVDREHQPRTDITLFNSVLIEFDVVGTSADQANGLVEAFKKRCPLYGTVKAASVEVRVTVRVSE